MIITGQKEFGKIAKSREREDEIFPASRGECIQEQTGGICAVTRCPKGFRDRPRGGTDRGTCEADKDRNRVWTLIYNTLKEKKRPQLLKDIYTPRDFSKIAQPRAHSVPPIGRP